MTVRHHSLFSDATILREKNFFFNQTFCFVFADPYNWLMGITGDLIFNCYYFNNWTLSLKFHICRWQGTKPQACKRVFKSLESRANHLIILIVLKPLTCLSNKQSRDSRIVVEINLPKISWCNYHQLDHPQAANQILHFSCQSVGYTNQSHMLTKFSVLKIFRLQIVIHWQICPYRGTAELHKLHAMGLGDSRLKILYFCTIYIINYC